MIERLLHLFTSYPLDFASHLSSGLPILIGFLRLRCLSVALKFTVLFYVFYFLKECYALWLSLLVKSNLYLQNIEAIANTWIFLAVFLYSFQSDRSKKLIVFFAVICSLISILTYQSNAVSSISLSTFRVFAIILCLAYFNKIVLDMQIGNILHHSMFWICAGLLIYSAGTFFIMLFSQYWYQDINKVPAEVFDKYWNVGQVLFVVFSCLSSVGLWVSKYERENAYAAL